MSRNIQPELQGKQKDGLKSSEDHFWEVKKTNFPKSISVGLE